MPRNYNLSTLKTLFGEASSCAYPGCQEPLIFRDRGKATVVAEIAHIRSEQPAGPRYDSGYAGDLDGPDNLVLLCGKHHRPVDRHESVYTITELEERQALTDVARLAQRVTRSCRTAQDRVDEVRAAAEAARQAALTRVGPIYDLHEDGSRTLNQSLQLSYVEQQEWEAKARTAWLAAIPSVEQARDRLDEEIAVLRMLAATLAPAAEGVSSAAAILPGKIGDAEALDAAVRTLDGAVSKPVSTGVGKPRGGS